MSTADQSHSVGKTPTNTLVSLRLQLIKATVLAESSILYFLSFHQILSATVMSIDMSQVGVTLPFFLTFFI